MAAILTPRRRARLPSLDRFGWLMALYAENHQRLRGLLPPGELAPGPWRSSCGDGLDLHLEVIEQHRYTTELRLSYTLRDPRTGMPDPSAHLRCYRDAALAEATHCYIGQDWLQALGMRRDAEIVLDHRLRMNTFLGKWLLYLGEQGHGPGTFERMIFDRMGQGHSARA
jgi:uncharacterized protein YqiB (DUF1249 family)